MHLWDNNMTFCQVLFPLDTYIEQLHILALQTVVFSSIYVLPFYGKLMNSVLIIQYFFQKALHLVILTFEQFKE